jgi:hypothetical protein
MQTLQEQLVKLESELDRMNKLAESGVMNEDGTAELVRNQLQNQISNLKKMIAQGN